MALSGSQTDIVGGKFDHILQPIKDLTKNWDVDIASLLEDYLEELENISISFDGGQSTMNFSQAAMLVQSSAGVYSKKVDYLYRLVSDVLNLLANKRKQGQKQANDASENETDAGVHDDGDDDEFLNLDDIQEGRNIVMKEDFDSGKEFVLLPEMPLCLLPLEGEKGEYPLLSKRGEVLASRKDFKMNTCNMHLSGAMLLDMTHLKFLEESLKHRHCADPVEMDTRSADLIEPAEISPDISTGDDHGDDGDIAADEVDGSIPLVEVSNGGIPLVEVSEPEHMEVENPLAGQGDGLRRSGRHRRTTLIAVPVKPQIDPWEPLDPHTETKIAKPVTHRGTVFKQCPGLEGTSKKRKRGKSKPAPILDPLSKYISRAYYLYTNKIPAKNKKSLLFSELEKILYAEITRRQSLLKEHKGSEPAWSEEDAEDDNDEAAAPDVDSIPGSDDGDELEPLVDENLFNAINEGIRCNNSFAQNHMPPDWLGDEIAVDSYEDLVRKHVEEYVASAQDYAQITELSRRVSDWEEKVIPRLEEEDNHAPFNINTYSSDILGRLQMGNTVGFQEVVEGRPIYEICRTFLATLMLANTGNVQIEAMDGEEGKVPTFGLKLLSTKRHFEELQEYQAPSVSQTNNT